MVAKLSLKEYRKAEAFVAPRIGRVDWKIDNGADFDQKFIFRDYDSKGQLTIPKDVSAIVWTGTIFTPFNNNVRYSLQLSTEDNSNGAVTADTLLVHIPKEDTITFNIHHRLVYEIDGDDDTVFKGLVIPVFGWYQAGAI